MKSTRTILTILGLTSSALLLPLAVRAQSPSPDPTATPSVSAPAPGTAGDAAAAPAVGEHRGHGAMKERLAALTPEEKERLKAARQKAMQDPAVVAAEANKATDPRAYRQAVHAATLRADPTIGEVLAKLHPKHAHKKAGEVTAE